MNIGLCPTLNIPLKLPVRIRLLKGVPKILAGGIPVTPLNMALQRRCRDEDSTLKSLNTYARAGRLYVEFCAHRHKSLIDISNEEFIHFKHALLGEAFIDAEGKAVRLSGKRGRRTADLMLTLLYSLTADIMERYEVAFDWRRYKGIPDSLAYAQYASRSFSKVRSKSLQRSHHWSWTPRKVLGLPDNQFVQVLKAAYERWGNTIVDGDIAFAEEPETQRGALFYRNVALLLVLRFAGSRRSEVVKLRFEDIDRSQSLIHLATKGHIEERLPVLMVPWVYNLIWLYVTRYRPIASNASAEDQQAIFVSHSVRNYGMQISEESIRSMVDTLRSVLQPPWNKRLTPHTLRHAFGYDLQKLLGPIAVTTGMRHRSIRSSEPYAAGPEVFGDKLLVPSNNILDDIFTRAGILEHLSQQFTQVNEIEVFHEE